MQPAQALPDALAAVASPTARAALVHATTELARALIASAGDDGHLATAAAAESLLTRVTTYVEQHLGEPDLDLARIAAANSISLRHLHALFAARGERPAEWMWRRRLEEAHRELARRAADRPAVAAVARRWGFSDPAHFSRRFRAAYGTTPREWVRANQPGADGAPR